MKFRINGFILYGYQRIHLIWLSDSSYMVINGFILYGQRIYLIWLSMDLSSASFYMDIQCWTHALLKIGNFIEFSGRRWQQMTSPTRRHTSWVGYFFECYKQLESMRGCKHPPTDSGATLIGSAGRAPDKTTSQLVNYVNFIFSISSWLLMDALTSSTATLYNFKYGFNISSATQIFGSNSHDFESLRESTTPLDTRGLLSWA